MVHIVTAIISSCFTDGDASRAVVAAPIPEVTLVVVVVLCNAITDELGEWAALIFRRTASVFVLIA